MPLGVVPIPGTLTADRQAWAGRVVSLSRWGSPPTLPAFAVTRVCDGKSCSDSKKNPPFVFLTHFLILWAILQRGTELEPDRPGLIPDAAPQWLPELDRRGGASEPQFPHL